MPESAELAESLANPQPRTLVEVPLGLHFDLPDSVYHQRELGIASRTALNEFDYSAASYRTWVSCEDAAPTPALLFGKAFHCAALEPQRFIREYIVEPEFGDCRTKGPKAEREAWRKANRWDEHDKAGTVLSVDEAKAITGMVGSMRAHRFVGTILGLDGHREVTARWDDQETGIPCKARADYWVPELATLVDLKSTLDARDHAFRRDAASYGYYRQDPFYRDGWRACGEPVEDFCFVVVEKTAPYLVAVYMLDPEDVAAGARRNRELLTSFADCLAKDTWPGLPEAVQTIKLAKWINK